jgi:hypothetical protein
MAAEITEITHSNQGLAEHIVTDLHEALRVLALIEATLTEFRPLLDTYRGMSPLAAGMAARRTRKARADG